MNANNVYRHHNEIMANAFLLLLNMGKFEEAERLKAMSQDASNCQILHSLIECASNATESWHKKANVLPLEHQHVIVYTTNGVLMSAEYMTGNDGNPSWFRFPGCVHDEDVVLWHPYPSPPSF